MAYMNQEKKQVIANAMKIALKDSGLKYSLRVVHGSGIKMTIRSGSIDFISNYNVKRRDTATKRGYDFQPATDRLDVNTYWIDENFDGEAAEIMHIIVDTLNTGNYNNSDSQSDYFDVGHYIDVQIGDYNKPYVLVR